MRAIGCGRGWSLWIVAAAIAAASPAFAMARVVPDGRAYELVSPAQKNGGDVVAEPGRTRAAADGSAMQFTSASGFDDVRATGLTADYVSVRDGRVGTQGWKTHAITPGPLDPLSAIDLTLGALDPRYVGELSPDLSTGVFLSNTSLSSGPSGSAVAPDIYLRSDLRTPGHGLYTLLSECLVCASPLPANPLDQPSFAGASSDFHHVIFESKDSRTADAPICSPGSCAVQLYEWENGDVRLVGVLPASEGGGVAPTSQAGQGALIGPGAFRAYSATAISQDGRRIFFTVRGNGNPRDGQLYMREDHSITVKLNASERSVPDAPAEARFQVATPDGEHVFFTTRENLVDSDNTSNSVDDLYMYSVSGSGSGHLTQVTSGFDAGAAGVIGASDDASYVYFLGTDNVIYRWHGGSLRTVASTPSDQLDNLVYSDWTISRKLSRISPDGTRLVFVSTAVDATPHSGAGDACPGGCREVFAYDATANGGDGELVCASCHPGGPSTSSQTDANFISRLGFANTSSHLNRPISDDGRFIFFDTGDRLTADDNNAVRDVYEYDMEARTPRLLSSGAVESAGAVFSDASSSGADVFFVTRDNLVGWDIDSNLDMYDARVGGGVPDPVVSSRVCTGDACHGRLSAPAAFGAPASSTFASRGNARKRTPRRCSRGHMRRKVHGKTRCIKRHKLTRRHPRVSMAPIWKGGR